MRVLAVVTGHRQHGVVQHGLTVARLVAGQGVQVDIERDLIVHHRSADLTHVHFTDALFGRDVGSAADAFVSWSRTVPRPLVVTLHDVPGQDLDPERDRRRCRGYERVVAACDTVIVCSPHEAGQFDGSVVPLPVEPLPAPGPRPAWADRPTAAVLGFVYPGKGHAEVLEAAACTGLRVVALGAASPGHGRLLDALHKAAAGLGVDLVVTGHLSAEDLHAGARAATVPVAAYRTQGSSASLATWLAAGRRPLALASPYARGLEQQWPGSLLLQELALTDRLSQALADPASTWRTGPAPRPDVGRLHLDVYACALG